MRPQNSIFIFVLFIVFSSCRKDEIQLCQYNIDHPDVHSSILIDSKDDKLSYEMSDVPRPTDLAPWKSCPNTFEIDFNCDGENDIRFLSSFYSYYDPDSGDGYAHVEASLVCLNISLTVLCEEVSDSLCSNSIYQGGVITERYHCHEKRDSTDAFQGMVTAFYPKVMDENAVVDVNSGAWRGDSLAVMYYSNYDELTYIGGGSSPLTGNHWTTYLDYRHREMGICL
ncbi:MAG: hypothetical protein ACI857_002463 [Arenicella sp.]